MRKGQISITVDRDLILSIMETRFNTSAFINESLKFTLENPKVKEHIMEILKVNADRKRKTRIMGFQRHTDTETSRDRQRDRHQPTPTILDKR